VLGQAGQKGGYLDSVHSAIPGWNDYINDDVTESTAYMVGQVACNVLFPEITLARDFTADVLRGDLVAVVLDSTGFLGPMRAYLGSSNIIPAFIAKVPQEVNAGNRIMSDLWRQGIYHTELPAIQKVAMLDKAFDGAASRLSGQGVADDMIAAVYESGGNIGKTMHIVESQTPGVQHIWLEEGKLGTAATNPLVKDRFGEGWLHILHNHVYHGDPAEHFDTVLGSNYATEAQVKQLIYDGATYGTQQGSPGYLYKIYDVPGTTEKIRIGLSDAGKIISAYPVINRIP